MDGASDTRRFQGMTVLVVEDYDTARKALCVIVRSYGAAEYELDS